jgi:IS5 family transposase
MVLPWISLRYGLTGAKRGATVAIKKKLKRRNAIESVIGHMKNDGRLGGNFLKNAQGDAMSALLCGAGHNLRKILRRLALCAPRYWNACNASDRSKMH